MSQIVKSALVDLLTNGPSSSRVGTKELTLAFGGLYIASTTLSAKPLLVWETATGYPRYYVPIASLHDRIKSNLNGGQAKPTNGAANGQKDRAVKLEAVESVKSKNGDAEGLIEKLTVVSISPLKSLYPLHCHQLH